MLSFSSSLAAQDYRLQMHESLLPIAREHLVPRLLQQILQDPKTQEKILKAYQENDGFRQRLEQSQTATIRNILSEEIQVELRVNLGEEVWKLIESLSIEASPEFRKRVDDQLDYLVESVLDSQLVYNINLEIDPQVESLELQARASGEKLSTKDLDLSNPDVLRGPMAVDWKDEDDSRLIETKAQIEADPRLKIESLEIDWIFNGRSMPLDLEFLKGRIWSFSEPLRLEVEAVAELGANPEEILRLNLQSITSNAMDTSLVREEIDFAVQELFKGDSISRIIGDLMAEGQLGELLFGLVEEVAEEALKPMSVPLVIVVQEDANGQPQFAMQVDSDEFRQERANWTREQRKKIIGVFRKEVPLSLIGRPKLAYKEGEGTEAELQLEFTLPYDFVFDFETEYFGFSSNVFGQDSHALLSEISEKLAGVNLAEGRGSKLYVRLDKDQGDEDFLFKLPFRWQENGSPEVHWDQLDVQLGLLDRTWLNTLEFEFLPGRKRLELAQALYASDFSKAIEESVPELLPVFWDFLGPQNQALVEEGFRTYLNDWISGLDVEIELPERVSSYKPLRLEVLSAHFERNAFKLEFGKLSDEERKSVASVDPALFPKESSESSGALLGGLVVNPSLLSEEIKTKLAMKEGVYLVTRADLPNFLQVRLHNVYADGVEINFLDLAFSKPQPPKELVMEWKLVLDEEKGYLAIPVAGNIEKAIQEFKLVTEGPDAPYGHNIRGGGDWLSKTGIWSLRTVRGLSNYLGIGGEIIANDLPASESNFNPVHLLSEAGYGVGRGLTHVEQNVLKGKVEKIVAEHQASIGKTLFPMLWERLNGAFVRIEAPLEAEAVQEVEEPEISPELERMNAIVESLRADARRGSEMRGGVDWNRVGRNAQNLNPDPDRFRGAEMIHPYGRRDSAPYIPMELTSQERQSRQNIFEAKAPEAEPDVGMVPRIFQTLREQALKVIENRVIPWDRAVGQIPLKKGDTESEAQDSFEPARDKVEREAENYIRNFLRDEKNVEKELSSLMEKLKISLVNLTSALPSTFDPTYDPRVDQEKPPIDLFGILQGQASKVLRGQIQEIQTRLRELNVADAMERSSRKSRWDYQLLHDWESLLLEQRKLLRENNLLQKKSSDELQLQALLDEIRLEMEGALEVDEPRIELSYWREKLSAQAQYFGGGTLEEKFVGRLNEALEKRDSNLLEQQVPSPFAFMTPGQCELPSGFDIVFDEAAEQMMPGIVGRRDKASEGAWSGGTDEDLIDSNGRVRLAVLAINHQVILDYVDRVTPELEKAIRDMVIYKDPAKKTGRFGIKKDFELQILEPRIDTSRGLALVRFQLRSKQKDLLLGINNQLDIEIPMTLQIRNRFLERPELEGQEVENQYELNFAVDPEWLVGEQGGYFAQNLEDTSIGVDRLFGNTVEKQIREQFLEYDQQGFLRGTAIRIPIPTQGLPGFGQTDEFGRPNGESSVRVGVDSPEFRSDRVLIPLFFQLNPELPAPASGEWQNLEIREFPNP